MEERIGQSIKLFKCLSDTSRIRIIQCLMEQPLYVELLSERLSLSPSTVSFHLKKLEDVGLVSQRKEQYYVIYELNTSPLNKCLADYILIETTERRLQEEREEEYRSKILAAFFEYGKLKSLPVQRKKKQIILESLAAHFEAGRDYTEKEVNLILADFHDDFCTLRREMVSARLLTRENGIYTLIGKE